MTLEALVTSDDDWTAYTGSDPDFFLGASGRTIRKYCGWWIYPSLTETAEKLRVGHAGIIILPATNVTAVTSVQLNHPNGENHTLTNDEYVWHRNGVIEPAHRYWPCWDCTATVNFTAGYSELPDDVKAVAFELAEQGLTVRNGNARQLDAPGGFRVITTQNFGLTLNPDQKGRLASYRIGGFA